MKRLYAVAVTRTLVVVAESEDAAHDAALAADDDGAATTRVEPLRYLPDDWDGACIPFGERDPADPDRTIAGWIAAGAAPGFRKGVY